MSSVQVRASELTCFHQIFSKASFISAGPRTRRMAASISSVRTGGALFALSPAFPQAPSFRVPAMLIVGMLPCGVGFVAHVQVELRRGAFVVKTWTSLDGSVWRLVWPVENGLRT